MRSPRSCRWAGQIHLPPVGPQRGGCLPPHTQPTPSRSPPLPPDRAPGVTLTTHLSGPRDGVPRAEGTARAPHWLRGKHRSKDNSFTKCPKC